LRWRFLVLVSLLGAIITSALWFGAIVAFFGRASLINLTWLWPASFAIPLAVSTAIGFFVYRHTSRRRKLQAVMAALLVITLTGLAYFATLQFLPTYLRLGAHNKSLTR
jgi:hypothetical protein